MKRWMVVFTFDKKRAAEIVQHIPQQQQHVKDMLAQGRLEALYLSSQPRGAFIIMRGETQEGIQKDVETFPLYPYLSTHKITPLLDVS